MTKDGYYPYRVEFVYRQKTYSQDFKSTAKITPETDSVIAWELAADAVKERMKTIENRVDGIYPHSVVIYGKFGEIKVNY
ncbi:MAG: hypothetical protein NC453_21170 [Muribaculum sp.]|nr:hypothetical protein [Muribaculum sp.]